MPSILNPGSATDNASFTGAAAKYHYTYMLNIDSGEDPRKKYIGVRSSVKRPEDDSYLCSSKHVINFLKENGEDKASKMVLAVWDSREEAVEHEMFLHDVFDVVKNPEFWNKSKQKSKGFDTTGLMAWNHGKKLEGVSKNKGVPKSEAQKEKQRQALLGRKMSEESKRKMVAAHVGRVRKTAECPTCKLKGDMTLLKRWHFDKCVGPRQVRARMVVDGVRVHIGRYPSKELAEQAVIQYCNERGIAVSNRRRKH